MKTAEDGRWSEGIQMRGIKGEGWWGKWWEEEMEWGEMNRRVSLEDKEEEKKRLRKKESVEQPNQRLAKCIGDLVSLPFPGFLSLINVWSRLQQQQYLHQALFKLQVGYSRERCDGEGGKRSNSFNVEREQQINWFENSHLSSEARFESLKTRQCLLVHISCLTRTHLEKRGACLTQNETKINSSPLVHTPPPGTGFCINMG